MSRLVTINDYFLNCIALWSYQWQILGKSVYVLCAWRKKNQLIFKSPNIGMSRKNSILFSFLLSMWSCLRNECTGTICKVRDWKLTLPVKMSCSWHSQTSVFTSHILKLGSCPHVLLLCLLVNIVTVNWKCSWAHEVISMPDFPPCPFHTEIFPDSQYHLMILCAVNN